MALFQRFWRRLTVISHAERLITDGPSSVGEVVMFGAGRIEHRELICYTFENRQLLAHPALDHTGSVPFGSVFGSTLPQIGFFACKLSKFTQVHPLVRLS